MYDIVLSFLTAFMLTYFAFAMVPITWWVLFRTRFGLRLRAVGENPGAVDTAGISVVRLRYTAVSVRFSSIPTIRPGLVQSGCRTV